MFHVASTCTPFAFCCVLLGVVAQSLKPVKLLNKQFQTFLLFCDRRSVAQQCWIRLHSSSNIHARKLHMVYKSLMGCILPTMHCSSQQCWQCTPLPTLLAQQCWDWWANNNAPVCTVLKVWQESNFAQQHARTSNKMQQGVQTDASCNIQQRWTCWPAMLSPFARC